MGGKGEFCIELAHYQSHGLKWPLLKFMGWILTPRDLRVWGHLEAGSLQRKVNYIWLLGMDPNPMWLTSLWEDNHQRETVPVTFLIAVIKYQMKAT